MQIEKNENSSNNSTQQNIISKELLVNKSLNTQNTDSSFEKDLKNNLKEKLLLAKQEVLYKERVIISSVFESVFQENYSEGFDSESVQKSLTFSYSNGLEPKVNIDKNKFKFTSELSERVSPFNINESKNTPYQKFRNREFEFDSLGRMKTFFNDDVIQAGRYTYDESQLESENSNNVYVGDWDDEIANTQLYDYNFKRINNPKRYEGMKGVSEVFDIAQMRSQQEINRIYKKEILPSIIKKYGKQK